MTPMTSTAPNLPAPRAVLADDERLMRDQLRARLAEVWPDLTIVAEAKNKAQDESARMIESARHEIDNQKKAAITELKNYVANLSIDVAEKVLREKLSDADKQSVLNNKLLTDISKN